MISTIAILGGGQAAAQAVDTLRRERFDGRLVLIGFEALTQVSRFYLELIGRIVAPLRRRDDACDEGS